MIISASPIRSYSTQTSERAHQGAYQHGSNQPVQQTTSPAASKVKQGDVGYNTNHVSGNSSPQTTLRTIDAVAFTNLLSQMGAVEGGSQHEPGRIIDVYT